jgi:hypothetical protein
MQSRRQAAAKTPHWTCTGGCPGRGLCQQGPQHTASALQLQHPPASIAPQKACTCPKHTWQQNATQPSCHPAHRRLYSHPDPRPKQGCVLCGWMAKMRRMMQERIDRREARVMLASYKGTLPMPNAQRRHTESSVPGCRKSHRQKHSELQQ